MNLKKTNISIIGLGDSGYWSAKLASLLGANVFVSDSKENIDDFFYFFGGGMPGLKGYTYYEESLIGPYYLVGTAVLRLPLFLEQNYTLAQI